MTNYNNLEVQMANQQIANKMLESEQFHALVNEKINQADKNKKEHWFSVGFTLGDVKGVVVKLDRFDTVEESRVGRNSFHAKWKNNDNYIASHNFGCRE